LISIAHHRRDLRVPSAVWFVAGAGVAAVALLHVRPTAGAGTAIAPVLVRSSCVAPTPLQLRTTDGRTEQTANLRGPGLYRLNVTDDALLDLVVATPAGLRRASDLPIGASGELLLPADWCGAPTTTADDDGPTAPASVGLLGP
jgi:hypothetical protein